MNSDNDFLSGSDPMEIHNYFRAGTYKIPLNKKTLIMGILNITPDSFSDGGRYNSLENAVKQAKSMVESGADIIDVGGESSRPGYEPVDADEEIRRILPVILALKQQVPVPISIDTWKSSVALKAVEAGASIINDIWGLRRDPRIADIASATDSGLVMMFNASDPKLAPKTENIAADAVRYLTESIRIARKAGVKDDQMMLDPGIGFGVTTKESLLLIKSLSTFRLMGFPVLIGPSRKRFIGEILDEPVDRRMIGTVAACCVGTCLGASAVRIHDVSEVTDAMKIRDAIMHSQEE